MRRAAGLAFLALLAASAAAAEADPRIAEADALLGDPSGFERAAALYAEVLSADPAAAELRLKRARVLAWAERYAESLDEYAVLLAEAGPPAAARIEQAEVLSWAGRHAEAEAAVGQAGYMTLAELRELHDRFGWDVAAHHATPFTELSPEELERAVRDIQLFLEGHGFGAGARHLAFPLGKYDVRRVMPVVRRHFQTARLASAGPETLPPADPHRLRVRNVLRTTRPEEIRAAARRAVTHREWLILMFHYLVDVPSLDTEYAIEDFRRVVELLAAEESPVRPLSEVWEEHATAR